MGPGRKGASLVPRRAELGRRAGDNPLLLNLQAAGLGLIRMDAGGYITEVNDKILEFTGYASFDLIGCHYTGIVDAASLDFTNLQIGEHGAEMADGEPYATPLIGKNRDLVWVYGATATLPEGGSLFVCQHFHAIGRKLVDMRGFIHGVRQQFLFAEFDMDGRLIVANSQFCDAFLYPLQEAIGLDHAALVDPAYAATEEYRRFWAALGRGVSHVVQGTRRGRHGHEVGVDAVYFPVPDARGIPGKVVFLARDLTLAYRLEKQRMEEARQSERVDALTGLQNRTSFLQSIQNYFNPMARRRAGSGMVMLVSIENFKELGKTYGHEASDAILWVVGNRIRHALRQHDISSRIERNLFGIFVERLPKNKEAIEEFSRKVLLQASGPIEFDGQQIDLAMCAGTVCSRGWQLAKAAGEEAILSCAQVALAAARAKGKGMFRIFDSQLANATARRQTIRRDLEPAIRAGDILLHYQPVVRLSDQMLVGYEALARWNHPALGAVGPDEFIVMAEQNGAIQTLGLYLLEKAVRFAATLPVEQWIAVNVSPIQLQRANFAQQAMEIIRRHGVDPARIDIEITESASLDQAHAVQENIRRLREAGFSISLDDFGTGFSSLAQLLSLRADRIKIDRGFTRECLGSQEKMGIIRSILGLSSAMGMKVVAEGIETPEISSLLMEMGCEYGQGYLFGRPQDLEQNKDVKGGRTAA